MNIKHLNKIISTLALIIVLIAIDPTKVEAHIPTIASDKHATPDTPLYLKDIVVSRAIYQRLTKKHPESYISFTAQKGQALDLEIGIPKISRLTNFRPNIALFHLPAPDNISATQKQVIKVMEVSTTESNPKVFHEPFTNTYSWILDKSIITLPFTGEYHLLSSHPNYESGKMWVAIGRQERFGPEDWGTLPASIVEVRLFHESDTPITKRHTVSFLLVGLIVAFSILIPIYFLRFKIKDLSRFLFNSFQRNGQ